MSFDRQAARALFDKADTRPTTPDRTPRRPIQSSDPQVVRAAPLAAATTVEAEDATFAQPGVYERLNRKPKRGPASIIVPSLIVLALVGGTALALMPKSVMAPAAEAPVATTTTTTTPAPIVTPPVAAAPAEAQPAAVSPPAKVEPAKPVAQARTVTTTSRPAARVATPRPRAASPAPIVTTPAPSATVAPSAPAPIVLPPPPAATAEPAPAPQ